MNSLPSNKPIGETMQSLVIDSTELLLQMTFDWAVSPPPSNPASAVDFLYVRLREPNGTLITTLFSINNRTTPVLTWQTASFDVTAYLESYLENDVVISFESVTSNQTVFVIDNVYLDSNIFPTLSTTTIEFDQFVYLPFVIKPSTTSVYIEPDSVFLSQQPAWLPNEAVVQPFEPGAMLQYSVQEN